MMTLILSIFFVCPICLTWWIYTRIQCARREMKKQADYVEYQLNHPPPPPTPPPPVPPKHVFVEVSGPYYYQPEKLLPVRIHCAYCKGWFNGNELACTSCGAPNDR